MCKHMFSGGIHLIINITLERSIPVGSSKIGNFSLSYSQVVNDDSLLHSVRIFNVVNTTLWSDDPT